MCMIGPWKMNLININKWIKKNQMVNNINPKIKRSRVSFEGVRMGNFNL